MWSINGCQRTECFLHHHKTYFWCTLCHKNIFCYELHAKILLFSLNVTWIDNYQIFCRIKPIPHYTFASGWWYLSIFFFFFMPNHPTVHPYAFHDTPKGTFASWSWYVSFSSSFLCQTIQQSTDPKMWATNGCQRMECVLYHRKTYFWYTLYQSIYLLLWFTCKDYPLQAECWESFELMIIKSCVGSNQSHITYWHPDSDISAFSSSFLGQTILRSVPMLFMRKFT